MATSLGIRTPSESRGAGIHNTDPELQRDEDVGERLPVRVVAVHSKVVYGNSAGHRT